MVAGVILVHGMIAQFLVVAPNTVGIEHVIILHQNMVVTTVHLTDPLILRLKSVMRIHAPVSLHLKTIVTMIVCPPMLPHFPMLYSKWGLG